jgi:hypothetical protein
MAAEATILRVPSEYWSIRTAVYAATESDTILVAPGIYRGSHNRAINFQGKNLTLRSEGGASVTTIDCEGQDRAFIFNNGENASLVEGFTITGGYSYSGGALRCAGSSPVFVSCAFEWNSVSHAGGGAVECLNGSSLTMRGCSFKRNMPEEAYQEGGAVYLYGASAVFEECSFVLNYAYKGAGVYADLSTVELTDCVFVDNATGGGVYTTRSAVTLRGCLAFRNFYGGYVSNSDVSVSVVGCTFSENYVRGILLWEGSAPVIANTIVAFTHPDYGSGVAIECGGSVSPLLSCCDLYGNEGGDWAGCVSDMYGVDGNICQDPQFCGGTDPEEAHSLDASSPCAPAANPDCGLIGAYDVGCGLTAVEHVSWGRIKGLFADRRRQPN